MHKLWLLVLLLTSAAGLAAQEVPKAEVFGGYSFTNEDFVSGGSRSNAHGWNASVTANVNHWFGLVTDFGGLYGASASRTISIPTLCPAFPCVPQTFLITTDGMTHSFLVGPQFSLRREKLTPFVHVLIGGARLNSSTTFQFPGPPPMPLFGPSSFSSSNLALALALGGGVDYKLKEKLASWRVQADYVQSGFSNSTQNNFRLSTGLVFHFK